MKSHTITVLKWLFVIAWISLTIYLVATGQRGASTAEYWYGDSSRAEAAEEQRQKDSE
jgi:hypothetical protein